MNTSFAIDPAKSRYLSLAHIGLDPDKVQLDLRGAGTTTPMLAPILAAGTNDVGTIQTAYARKWHLWYGTNPEQPDPREYRNRYYVDKCSRSWSALRSKSLRHEAHV